MSTHQSSPTIDLPILTPCPITDRWQRMVPVPSSAIETNASVLSVHPLGIPPAPYFLGSWARAVDWSPTASTRPPRDIPFKKRRRLTLASTIESSDTERNTRSTTGALIAHLPAWPRLA